VSKPSLVTILAEDKNHQRFVYRFLRERGFPAHQIRSLPLPSNSGGGAGEQWVRRHYSGAVQALRNRASKASTALVAVIDADAETVAKREQRLRESLQVSGLSGREHDEAIVHLIPKRNIETWLLFLTGSDVDEESDYKRSRNPEVWTGMIPSAARTFALHVKGLNRSNLETVPSLAAAIGEAARFPA